MIGSRTRAKVVKNKVAAPFREAEFDILYGEGVSREGDLIDLGVEKGVLEKAGTWISYNSERLGQGRENVRIFLKEHVDVRRKLETELRKKMGIPIPGAANGNVVLGLKKLQKRLRKSLSHRPPSRVLLLPLPRPSANKPRPMK